MLSRPRDPGTAEPLLGAGVELVDVDDRHDLVAAYRRAWGLRPSFAGRGIGLVLLEAMACGTPVVATDREGMREVADGGEVGRLFEGGEQELAAALLEALELAEDPATAAACRRRAEEYSSERCVSGYEELYEELSYAS